MFEIGDEWSEENGRQSDRGKNAPKRTQGIVEKVPSLQDGQVSIGVFQRRLERQGQFPLGYIRYTFRYRYFPLRSVIKTVTRI